MNTSLENLVDNLSEINNKDCKKRIEINKIKSGCKLIKLKDNRLIYKCKTCNDISYKLILDSIHKFPNTYRFCNKDLNKFVLSLRKSTYPYEYMDSRERFDKTKVPPKKDFYCNFNLEDITDEVYAHAKKSMEYI